MILTAPLRLSGICFPAIVLLFSVACATTGEPKLPPKRPLRADIEAVCAAGDPLAAVPGQITNEDITRLLCLIGCAAGIDDANKIRSINAAAFEQARSCGGPNMPMPESAQAPTDFVSLRASLISIADTASKNQAGCGARSVVKGIVVALGRDSQLAPIEKNTLSVLGTRSVSEEGQPAFAIVNQNVLYARYPFFGPDAHKAFQTATTKAQSEHSIIGFILDLRGCHGGKVDEIVRFLDLFFDEGVLVESRNRIDGRAVIEHATRNPPALRNPMVVLIDQQTSSGGEVVAAGLRRRAHAMLLGRKSMGWATITFSASLPSRSLVQLPKGDLWEFEVGPISGRGVSPDVEFSDLAGPTCANDEDRMLLAAYGILAGARSGGRQELISSARQRLKTPRQAQCPGATGSGQ